MLNGCLQKAYDFICLIIVNLHYNASILIIFSILYRDCTGRSLLPGRRFHSSTFHQLAHPRYHIWGGCKRVELL